MNELKEVFGDIKIEVESIFGTWFDFKRTRFHFRGVAYFYQLT